MTTPRAMWSGSISFGMVVVPVKLHAATEEREGVQFRQVRRSDGSRIQYRRVSAADGEEVPYSEIAKGFEWGSDIIVFTDDDMASLPLATTKQIQVMHFCHESEIDSVMLGKTYYITPASPAAERAYALMSNAMGQSGALGAKVAIAKVALRQRESLAMVRRTIGGTLELTLLLWPEEVREVPVFEFPKLTDAEDQMACKLVDMLTEPFDASKHHDRYREAVLALAERKMSSVKPEGPQEEVKPEDTPAGLMEALQASVAAFKAAGE